MQPHHTRLKVGCRSAVASAPQKWWAREELHLQGSQILDLWGLLFPLNHSPEKNGASRRCCPGATFLQRKPAGCRKEAKWSQSPVLPWTRPAYETCLSAGSTAFGIWKWSPHPELHQAGLLTEQAHGWQCFGGMENGRRETTCTSRAAWFSTRWVCYSPLFRDSDERHPGKAPGVGCSGGPGEHAADTLKLPFLTSPAPTAHKYP